MTIERVKAAITDKAMSAEEMAQAMNISRSTVSRALSRLRELGQVRQAYIDSWYRPPGSKNATARYRLGDLPDAERPFADITQIERQRRIAQVTRQREDEERKRLTPAGQILTASNDPVSFWVTRKEA